jgi:GH43 family beta-xylosidase
MKYYQQFIKLNLFIVEIIRSKPVQATNVSTFYNVIAQDGADPWVYKHTDGWYYMTRSTGGDVRIWRSRTFTSIDAGDTIVAWTPPSSGPACKGIWAPELHFIQSRW